MSALTTHAAGVEAAERELLNSTCTVTRPAASSGEVDPTTGMPAAATPTVIYPVENDPHPRPGRCWLKWPSAAGVTQSSRSVDTAGTRVLYLSPMVGLPLSAPLLRAGDVITCTASPVPHNVGRTLVVTGSVGGDLIVLARYECEDLIR